jgi:hypothetical protein
MGKHAQQHEERPPWVEEAEDATWWDLAFGSYGDGYLEWVHNRYYWEPADERTVADTRSLWHHRRRYKAHARERLEEVERDLRLRRRA